MWHPAWFWVLCWVMHFGFAILTVVMQSVVILNVSMTTPDYKCYSEWHILVLPFCLLSCSVVILNASMTTVDSACYAEWRILALPFWLLSCRVLLFWMSTWQHQIMSVILSDAFWYCHSFCCHAECCYSECQHDNTRFCVLFWVTHFGTAILTVVVQCSYSECQHDNTRFWVSCCVTHFGIAILTVVMQSVVMLKLSYRASLYWISVCWALLCPKI